LIDPTTGKPTTWGFWGPAELNDNPVRVSERGGNSVGILAWLTGAYSITGNETYATLFWSLVNDHDYIVNTLNAKIDSVTDENHSDTELLYLTYHAMYYAYQRLPANHPRAPAVFKMVSLMTPSFQRSWRLTKGELSPLWTAITLGTAAPVANITDDAARATAGTSLFNFTSACFGVAFFFFFFRLLSMCC
jgi:hypothetical protein